MTPIERRIRQYEALLKSRQRRPRYVNDVIRNVRDVVRAAGITSVKKITKPVIEQAINDVAIQNKLAPNSVGQAIAYCKAFVTWLYQSEHIKRNKLEALKAPRGQKNVRPRRPLTDDEVDRLIEATELKDSTSVMPGQHRAWLYRLAVLTGLRCNTLLALTPGHFVLAGGVPPYVRRKAAENKNGRDDKLPIHSFLAKALRIWLRDKEPDKLLFPVCDKTARSMLARDLVAAGIDAKADDEGRVLDFHAFRHTFCTRVGRARLPMKAQMALMGHRSYSMTLKYQHVDESELSEMINEVYQVGLDGRPHPKPKKETGNEYLASGTAGGGTDSGIGDGAQPGGGEQQGPPSRPGDEGTSGHGGGSGGGVVEPRPSLPDRILPKHEGLEGDSGGTGGEGAADGEGPERPVAGAGEADTTTVKEEVTCRACGVRKTTFSFGLCRKCAGLDIGVPEI